VTSEVNACVQITKAQTPLVQSVVDKSTANKQQVHNKSTLDRNSGVIELKYTVSDRKT